MRIHRLLPLAALGASVLSCAATVVMPPATNPVVLTWDSLGPGTRYYVETSTDLLTWTNATNTIATNASLTFTGDTARIFRLWTSNAPPQKVTLDWDSSAPSTDIAGYFIDYGSAPNSYTKPGGRRVGNERGGFQPGGRNDLLLCRDRLLVRRLGIGLLEWGRVAIPVCIEVPVFAVPVIVREFVCVISRSRMEVNIMTLYLSQKCWGRVCLHLIAALRAGHWGWHLAGIGREIGSIWPQPRLALALANDWPEPIIRRKAKRT